jgi:tetratricopeptide (TPR) repeat protein
MVQIQAGIDAVKRFHVSGLLEGEIEIIQAGADLGSSLCIYTLGNIYYSGIGMESDPEKASFYWKQTEHFYASACHNLAYLAKKNGDVTQAADYFRKAISLRPRSFYYIQLADLLGPTEEAVGLYTTALPLSDLNEKARIHLMLGKIAYIRRNTTEAYGHFNRSLQINPTNNFAQVMAALSSKKTSIAHTHLDVVLSRDRNHLEAICLKGHIFVSEQNKDQAEAMLRRACSISPNAHRTEELKTVMRSFGPLTRKRCREGN